MKQFEETRLNRFYCTEEGLIFKEDKLQKSIEQMKPAVNNRGYQVVYANGPKFVHRIIACAFVQGDHSLQVNHKDGVKLNNHYTNLEWVTCSENLRHAVKLKLNPQAGETHKKAKLTAALVSKLRAEWDRSYSSLQDYATPYNVSSASMYLALTGKTWKEVDTPAKTLLKLNQPHNKILSEELLEDLSNSFVDDSEFYKKVALEYGITFSYLMSRLRAYNPSLPNLTKKVRQSKVKNLVTAEVIDRINSGEKIAHIARELNIPRKTLSVLYNRTRA